MENSSNTRNNSNQTYNQKFPSSGKLTLPQPQQLTEIQSEQIDWLVEGLLGRKIIHLIDGLPGSMKTTLMLHIAAQLSRGETPTGDQIDPVRTLYISSEDTAGLGIKPRYMAAGGEEDHLSVYDVTTKVTIPDDLETLEHYIREGGFSLVVIDPLFGVLGREYSKNMEQDTRDVLQQLHLIAEKTETSIVLVRHLNKKEGLSAINRGGGSIGIIGYARLALMLGEHPDDPENKVVLAWSKNNYSHLSEYEAFVYWKTSRIDPESGGSNPGVEWSGMEPLTADDLLSSSKGRPPTKRRKARFFLESELADGSKPSTDLLEAAEDQGISESTLNRAKEDVGVQSVKTGNHWSWALPSETTGDDS